VQCLLLVIARLQLLCHASESWVDALASAASPASVPFFLALRYCPPAHAATGLGTTAQGEATTNCKVLMDAANIGWASPGLQVCGLDPTRRQGTYRLDSSAPRRNVPRNAMQLAWSDDASSTAVTGTRLADTCSAL